MVYLLIDYLFDTMTVRLLLLFVLLHVGFWDELALLGQLRYHGVLINDVSIIHVFVLPLRPDLLLTRLLLWALYIAKKILS